MLRGILSLLLIVNLLACPAALCVLLSGRTGRQRVAVRLLLLLRQSCDVPESDTPADSPEEECQCQDCICEGATLRDAPELPDSSTAAIFVIALPGVKRVGNKHLCRVEPCDRRFVLGGRGMRIAQQSLLN